MAPYLLFLIFYSVKALDKLLYVIEYGRHGARYPEFALLPWNQAPMDLTGAGMRQQYLLGRAIRDHYKDFLDSQYNPKQIKVRSTYKHRTIASAYARVMGLYHSQSQNNLTREEAKRALPPNAFDYGDWVEELGDKAVKGGMQVVPVSCVGIDNDYLLEPKIACPTLASVTKAYKKLHSNEIEAFHQNNKKLYQKLFRVANISERDLNKNDILKVRNSLACGLFEGKLGIDNKHAAELDKNSTFIYYRLKFNNYQKVSYGDYKVSKVMATPFLQHVKRTLLQIAQGKNTERKYEMYVASDTLMHAILLQLGYYDEIEVPFSSVLYFELYRTIKGSYYINVIFNSAPNKKYGLKEFSTLIDKATYSENDFKNYCTHYTIREAPRIGLVMIGLIGGSLLLIVYMIIAYLKRYQGRKLLTDKEYC